MDPRIRKLTINNNWLIGVLATWSPLRHVTPWRIWCHPFPPFLAKNAAFAERYKPGGQTYAIVAF
jgi:hypothetical protein